MPLPSPSQIETGRRLLVAALHLGGLAVMVPGAELVHPQHLAAVLSATFLDGGHLVFLAVVEGLDLAARLLWRPAAAAVLVV